jgi:hypothetical protein
MARIDISKDPVKFKNSNRAMRVPFTIYADFETFNVKINSCQPNSNQSYTQKIMKQVPSLFCFYLVSSVIGASLASSVTSGGAHAASGERFEPATYTAQGDEDIGMMFSIPLIEYTHMIYNKYEKHPKPMQIRDEEQASFDSATHCYICEQKLIRREDCANELDYACFETHGLNSVRDHCHVTDFYRGPAHSRRNLQHQLPDFYSVAIHNLSCFDTHLFIKELKGKIKCIPTTDEKYVSFTREVAVDQTIDKTCKKVTIIRNLRFIDSYKFMPASLDSLLKNLKTHPHLRRFYQEKQLQLLLKKGVYPYEWGDSPEQFNETQLPPKEAFYSQLNGAGISDEENEHTQKVWEAFYCKTFRGYHNLYNTADVLQLANIFESFRDVCMKSYKLDPAWYYTAPGLAWDACLKLTGITLELPQTYEMLLLIKSGTRGGISSIMNRYAKANNKYMSDYDAKMPSTFIKYLDAFNSGSDNSSHIVGSPSTMIIGGLFSSR